MKKTEIKNLTLAGIFIALGFVLPFLGGPAFGSVWLPMHIPVLLCGFICGPVYGLAVGFILPLLRMLFLGMPPMPFAAIMAFELATYGLLAGLFYKMLPKKPQFIYMTLILAMLGGRVIWGVVSYLVFILGIGLNDGFGLTAFTTGAFVTALPGIVIQLVLIPAVIIGVKKAKLIK